MILTPDGIISSIRKKEKGIEGSWLPQWNAGVGLMRELNWYRTMKTLFGLYGNC